jgi:magnesium-transporting ATPase (P-type)
VPLNSQTDDKLAILITGKSLQFVMEDETSRAIFLQLCRIAKVVIACRVIPSQKVGASAIHDSLLSRIQSA